MKGLLLTAFSLLLAGAAFAQENELDGAAANTSPTHRAWNRVSTIALAPVQYSENGVGFGISYELALDHDGYLSFYVAVIGTYNINKNTHADNRSQDYNYPIDPPYKNNVMYYAMPGVKYYPTGMGKVKYAVGPSLVVGLGRKEVYQYGMTNSHGGSYDTYTPERFLLGTMINNSLNINATAHLYIGAEMGFGFTYLDKIDNVNQGVAFLTQGSFKMGYTF